VQSDTTVGSALDTLHTSVAMVFSTQGASGEEPGVERSATPCSVARRRSGLGLAETPERLPAGKSRLWNQIQRAQQFPVVIDAGIGGREKFVAVKDGIGSGEQAESLGFS
jgi:hypothetical protein